MNNKYITSESLVVAMDTATPVQSLSICRGSRVLFEAAIPTQTTDAPGLLSLLDASLAQAAVKLEDIEGFVVSRGPGAFTGLRVSMAMLKSLSLTLDVPLYHTSSLEAMAWANMPSQGLLASCIDARRGEIYVAFYIYKDGMVQSVSDELLLKPEDFVHYIDNAFPDMFIQCVGTAFPNYTFKITGLTDKVLCRYDYPRAALSAKIALSRYAGQEPDVPLEVLEPKYIRQDDFALPTPFDFTNPGQFRAKRNEHRADK